MLTPYRRHTKKCKKTKGFPDKEVKKCQCPLWVIGTDLRDEYHRESLDTRELWTATERIRALELGDKPETSEKGTDISITDAFLKYKAVLIGQRGLKQTTINTGLQPVEKSLTAFAVHKGIGLLRQLDSACLDEWISTLVSSQATRAVRIGFVKRFFSFAFSRKLIDTDPALLLTKPKIGRKGKTKPFRLEDEDKRIMDAAGYWEQGVKLKRRVMASTWLRHPRTATALLLVLRHTGLRIGDALLFDPRSLQKRTIKGKPVYCYFVAKQQKTGDSVFLPIETDIAERIIFAPRLTERYAFWDGETDLRAWGTMFAASCLSFLETVSGVPNIHAHRFRDTFAMDHLSNGMDIRSVSRLLGHASVATTLQYYEHWIVSDQDKMLDVAMQSWERKEAGGKVISIAQKKA